MIILTTPRSLFVLGRPDLVSSPLWLQPHVLRSLDSFFCVRLESLEQLFFFAATRKKLECDAKGRVEIPFSLIKQQKCQVTIPATSPYAIGLFHNQEKERFDDYGRAYTFEIQVSRLLPLPLPLLFSSLLQFRLDGPA